MADVVSPEKRSQMMAGIKSGNTSPELAVRKTLHAAGFRFRLHKRDLPGRPDIVLPKYKTAIFVNGCFWHGHENCRLFRLPKSRTEFWETKITGNRARDARDIQALQHLGWKSVVVWECAVKGKGRLSDQLLSNALKEALVSNKNPMIEVRGTTLG